MRRFPRMGLDLLDLLNGDETLIVTLHAHGVPRARPPYITQPYTESPLPEGDEDMIGNRRVLIQLGVRDRNGDLHTERKEVIPKEQRDTFIKNFLESGGVVEDSSCV